MTNYQLYDSETTITHMRQHVNDTDRLTEILWYLWHHQYSQHINAAQIPTLTAQQRHNALSIADSYGIANTIMVIAIPSSDDALQHFVDYHVNTMVTVGTTCYAVISKEDASWLTQLRLLQQQLN